MGIPDYVRDISEQTYESMRREGKFDNLGDEAPITKTHVASIFMIAAIESDPETSIWLLHNEGKRIQPLAGLLQYSEPNVLREAMEYAVTELFNYEAHGAAALAVLAEASIYKCRAAQQWSAKTLHGLLSELEKIPLEDFEIEEGEPKSVEMRSMNAILSLAENHVKSQGDDADTVKEAVLAFAIKYLKAKAETGEKLAYLTPPARIIEKFAPDEGFDELKNLVKDAYDLEAFSKSKFFKIIQKSNPRLLGDFRARPIGLTPTKN